MEKIKRELFTGNTPMIRENGGKESRFITGYAIVFNVQSELLADWTDSYREIISPNALTMADLNRWDIQMTMWHNREKLIARRTKGKGTLDLKIDSIGVRYTFEAPSTPDGETALELVRRGDIAGASFTFTTSEDNVTYSKDSNGTIIRTVNKLDMVYEMTLASDPAYSQTSADLREMPKGVKELLKREDMKKENQEKKYVKGPSKEEIAYMRHILNQEKEEFQARLKYNYWN